MFALLGPRRKRRARPSVGPSAVAPGASVQGVSVPPELFGDDYLYFYTDILGEERSDADADVVAGLLGLRPGMRVLDVPCGEGRIAGRLASRGCEVVGLDVSERFLATARRRHPEVTFVHGDMRELDYRSEFDAVVNWFTSFGYFDPAVNDAVLAGFARALRPTGQLLVELLNPELVARLVELAGGTVAQVMEREGDLLVDRVRYDPDEGLSHTERWIVRDGAVRRLSFSLEQVPGPKLRERLCRAGFSEVELFGRGGEPFDPEGTRLIALARR
jgi:SAM-dependent methyltransferase